MKPSKEPQDEQDSLMNPVFRTSSEDDDDCSFQHVPSKEKVAAKGGEPKVSFYP